MPDLDYINKYLTEEDRVRIAEEMYRNFLAAKIHEDKERIVCNAAYQAVSKLCDELIPDFHNLLLEKVKGVITKLSAYTVFEEPNGYGGKGSVGWHMLNEITNSKKERIQNKVDKIIDELKPEDVYIDIQDEVRQMLLKRLGWEQGE